MADDNLKFFDNIDEARRSLGSIDLIFTSSALQYCANPLAVLEGLTQINAKYLFLTRTPFNDSEEPIVSIQISRLSDNGPGLLPPGIDDVDVSFPITFVSKSSIEKILKERYEIRFSVCEDKGTFRAGNKKFDMYGYFCALK